MKILKTLLFNPFAMLLSVAFFGLFICALLQKPVKKYVGTVISVSSWSGSAELKTKTELSKDTIIIVHPRRFEYFEVNQVITVWTGGDLIDNIGTTNPLK